MATDAGEPLGSFLQIESEEVGQEVRSAMEWAQVRALEADGVSQRQIAKRLGIDPRTVKRLAESDEPPSYHRAPTGSTYL